MVDFSVYTAGSKLFSLALTLVELDGKLLLVSYAETVVHTRRRLGLPQRSQTHRVSRGGR